MPKNPFEVLPFVYPECNSRMGAAVPTHVVRAQGDLIPHITLSKFRYVFILGPAAISQASGKAKKNNYMDMSLAVYLLAALQTY